MRIVVIGGGIAGTEAALTLALTLPEAEVQLVSEAPEMVVKPNLVYVPFGLRQETIYVPLNPLADFGIHLVHGHCERVDPERKRVLLDDGARHLDYDLLVVALGSVPQRSAGLRLRTVEDALSLRTRLLHLQQDIVSSKGSRPQEVLIRVMAESTWSPPAYELALLTDTWLRFHQARALTQVTVATNEMTPLSLYEYRVAKQLRDILRERSITMLTGIQPQRVEDFEAEVVIDVGLFTAQTLVGLRGLNSLGFYEVADDGRLGEYEDIFVVGDAASHIYKGAFATAPQARRVATALGGDLSRLHGFVDGVELGHYEYEMDLGDGVAVIDMRESSYVRSHSLRTDAELTIEKRAPDKLRGTLTRQLLVSPHLQQRGSQQAFAQLLAMQEHLA